MSDFHWPASRGGSSTAEPEEPKEPKEPSQWEPRTKRQRRASTKPLTYTDLMRSFHQKADGTDNPLSLDVLCLLEAGVRLIVDLAYYYCICVLDITCNNVVVDLASSEEYDRTASLVHMNPEFIVFLEDDVNDKPSSDKVESHRSNMSKAYGAYLMMCIYTHSLAVNLGNVAFHSDFYNLAFTFFCERLAPSDFVPHGWLSFKLPGHLAESTQRFLNQYPKTPELQRLLLEGCWIKNVGEATLSTTIPPAPAKIAADIDDVYVEVWRLFATWRQQNPEAPHTDRAFGVFLTSCMPVPSPQTCLLDATAMSAGLPSTLDNLQRQDIHSTTYELWRRASFGFLFSDIRHAFSSFLQHLSTRYLNWQHECGVQNWLASQLPLWSLEMSALYDIKGYAPALFLDWIVTRWRAQPPNDIPDKFKQEDAFRKYISSKLYGAWSPKHLLHEWFSRQEWARTPKWQKLWQAYSYDEKYPGYELSWDHILNLCRQAILEEGHGKFHPDVTQKTKNIIVVDKIQETVALWIWSQYRPFQRSHWHAFSLWLMAQPWTQTISFSTWLENKAVQLDDAVAEASPLTFLWRRLPFRYMDIIHTEARSTMDILSTTLSMINIAPDSDFEQYNLWHSLAGQYDIDLTTRPITEFIPKRAKTPGHVTPDLDVRFMRVTVPLWLQSNYRDLTDFWMASRRLENPTVTYKHLYQTIKRLFQCWSCHYTVGNVLKDCWDRYPSLKPPEHIRTGPPVKDIWTRGGISQGLPESILEVAQKIWNIGHDKLNKRDYIKKLQDQIRVFVQPSTHESAGGLASGFLGTDDGADDYSRRLDEIRVHPFPLEPLLAPMDAIDAVHDIESFESHIFWTLCWSLYQLYSLHAAQMFWTQLCRYEIFDPASPDQRMAEIIPGRTPPPSSTFPQRRSGTIDDYVPHHITTRIWNKTRYRWVEDVINILDNVPLLTFSRLCHGLSDIFRARHSTGGYRDTWSEFCLKVRDEVENAPIVNGHDKSTSLLHGINALPGDKKDEKDDHMVTLVRRFYPPSTGVFTGDVVEEEPDDKNPRSPIIQKRHEPLRPPIWPESLTSTYYQAFHRYHVQSPHKFGTVAYHEEVKDLETTLWKTWTLVPNIDTFLDAVRAQPFTAQTRIPVDAFPSALFIERCPKESLLHLQQVCKAWCAWKPQRQFETTRRFFLQDRGHDPYFVWGDLFLGRYTLNLHLEQILDPTTVPFKGLFILDSGLEMVYPAELNMTTPRVNYVLEREKKAPFLLQSICEDTSLWQTRFEQVRKKLLQDTSLWQTSFEQVREEHSLLAPLSSFTSPWPLPWAYKEKTRQLPTLKQLNLFLTGHSSLALREHGFVLGAIGASRGMKKALVETKTPLDSFISMLSTPEASNLLTDAFGQFPHKEDEETPPTGRHVIGIQPDLPLTLFEWDPAFPPPPADLRPPLPPT